MKFLSVCVLLLIGFSLNAQVILVRLNINDCGKCKLIFGSYINTQFGNIPSMLIFPETMKMDSLEIKSAIDDPYLNNNIVYSNKYDKLLDHISISNIAYLSAEGKVLFQKAINDFTSLDGNTIDSLYRSDVLYRSERPNLMTIVDGKAVKFSFQLGYIQADVTGTSNRYNVSGAKLEFIKTSLNEKYPDFYSYTDMRLSQGVPDAFYKAKIGNYFCINRNLYYSVMLPFDEFVVSDSIRKMIKGDSIITNRKYLIVKEQYDGTSKVFPIVLPTAMFGRKSFYVYANHSFAMIDDTTFIFRYSPFDWQKYPEEKTALATFKLRNDLIVFDRFLKNEIPDIYLKSGIGYMYSNFSCFDYPYFIELMGTELSDLSNENNYSFNPPFKINYDYLDAQFSSKVAQGKVDYPILNMGLFKDVKSGKLYLVSKSNGTAYLMVFSLKNLKLETTIDLKAKGLNLYSDKPFFIFYDYQKQALIIEDKDNNLRFIPVDLLY